MVMVGEDDKGLVMPTKAAYALFIVVHVPYKNAEAQAMPVMSINFPKIQEEALVAIFFCLCSLG